MGWKGRWRRKWNTYLASGHWKALRQAAFKRDGYKCVVCGSGTRLRGHHKHYRPDLRDCTVDDIETLCNDCHEEHHRKEAALNRAERKAKKKQDHLVSLITEFSAEDQ